MPRQLKTELFLALLFIASLGCEPGDISFVRVDASEGVSRVTLTVVAAVDAADSALADSLGWDGVVPGAEVNVLRNGTDQWITQRTDWSGVARFERLLPGIYRVYGGKVLTPAEAVAVGGVLRAFGDGNTELVMGDTTVELRLYGDRPRSLVIAEIATGEPRPWEVSYNLSKYFEVYNNSDSTVYLDGVLFGDWWIWTTHTAHTSCAVSEPWRRDSLGVGARAMLAFPGTGREYPIAPGEVKVVAVAAIDHTPVHPTTLDLSNADFEIGSPAVANNPAVPDMLDVGLESWSAYNGPGHRLTGATSAYFLALPVDVSSLDVMYRDLQGREWLRMPRSTVLDFVRLTSVWPESDLEYPPCLNGMHPIFERYEGGFHRIGFDIDYESSEIHSYERRVLHDTSGRLILQNTNTTAFDFFSSTRTPGRLP
jgi:hypothetical protein